MKGTQSVVGAICSSYDTFYEAEKKIADCIVSRKAEVVDMTVAKLAKASGTSDATVSRFCRRCGFEGFQNLKMALAKEVLEEEREALHPGNEVSRGNITQSIGNILANKVAELTETANMMRADQLEKILSVIENARMVQLAAVGNAIPVALDAAYKFNQLGIAAVASAVWENQMAYVLNAGREDAVILISNAGSSRRLLTLSGEAKKNGCTVITITASDSSPLAGTGDYNIITSTREKLLADHSWYSRIAATMVVEILYLLLMDGREHVQEHVLRHRETVLLERS